MSSRSPDGVFYLTTPIYYINGPPHLGHAYTTIVADTMARYRRLAGDDVFFLTGTDEHGDKIAQAAAKAGEPPQALADRNSKAFRDQWDALGITPRRLHPHDRAAATRAWSRRSCRSSSTRARSTSASTAASTASAASASTPRRRSSTGSARTTRRRSRTSRRRTTSSGCRRTRTGSGGYLEEHPDVVQPERYRNELLGFLREPLQDLSISRPKSRLQWGIPLPFDDRFVTYVWFDALLNYVSALGGPGGRPVPAVLAARPAPDRQGHPQAPRDLLAVHAEGGRAAPGDVGRRRPARLRAAPGERLLDARGREDVEERRQRGRRPRAHPEVRQRRLPLLRAPGDAVRPGRELLGGGARRAAQRGPRQRPREPRLARDHAGRELRRAGRRDAPAAPGAAERRDRARRPPDDARGRRRGMDEFAFHAALVEIWEFIGAAQPLRRQPRSPWALAKDPAQRRRLATCWPRSPTRSAYLGIVLEPFLPDAAARIRARDRRHAARRRWRTPAVGGRAAPGISRREQLSGLFPRVDTKATRRGGARPRRPAAPRRAGDRPRDHASTSSSASTCGSPRSSRPSRCRSRRSS